MTKPIDLLVKAGAHERLHTPVSIKLSDNPLSGRLTRGDTGTEVPCQIHKGALWFVIDELAADSEMRLTFEPEVNRLDTSPGVRFDSRYADSRIEVKIGEQEFTSYQYDTKFPRPHFYPFLGPDQKQITRNYPMAEVEGETTDHIHHRSVWVAFGDVNGTDNWIEEGEHGWQTHSQLIYVVDGPVLGEFQHHLEWEDHDHRCVMKETRTACFYATPDTARLMDLTVTLKAQDSDVRLGDTKEGAFCSVRVATSMDANKGGRIENSVGGVGESECWGKPAHWCDYSGPVEGQEMGIAIFDHPMNLRHPTCWHVRDYGLMTANPFGYATYRSSFLKDGTHTIPDGSALTFRYRLCVHRHDAHGGKVNDRYHDYVNPPVVEIDA